MNWILAFAAAGVLLIAGCAVWVNAASKSAEDIYDFAGRVVCYDSGWQAGVLGEQDDPPYDDSRCRSLYADGYDDGRAGTYAPPQE